MLNRTKRHKRNIADMRDPNTDYPFDRYGLITNNKKMYDCNTMPIPSNADILGWDYPPEKLITLFKIISGLKTSKKDFTHSQIVFEPKILVYMIFLSEDDKLIKYLKSWKKYKPHINMKINEKLITPELRAYCSCEGCFGTCVKIIMKYNVLPNIINNTMLSNFMYGDDSDSD